MTLTVSCGICNKTLAIVIKDTITSDDVNLYTNDCSCDQDGQANIQTQTTS